MGLACCCGPAASITSWALFSVSPRHEETNNGLILIYPILAHTSFFLNILITRRFKDFSQVFHDQMISLFTHFPQSVLFSWSAPFRGSGNKPSRWYCYARRSKLAVLCETQVGPASASLNTLCAAPLLCFLIQTVDGRSHCQASCFLQWLTAFVTLPPPPHTHIVFGFCF